MKYFTEAEFENKIKEKGQIIQGIKFQELNEKFNNNNFFPLDGELIKACDKLAAFIESSSSIKYGITSKYLEEAKEKSYNENKDAKVSGIEFGRIFDYFYNKQWNYHFSYFTSSDNSFLFFLTNFISSISKRRKYDGFNFFRQFQNVFAASTSKAPIQHVPSLRLVAARII